MENIMKSINRWPLLLLVALAFIATTFAAFAIPYSEGKGHKVPALNPAEIDEILDADLGQEIAQVKFCNIELTDNDVDQFEKLMGVEPDECEKTKHRFDAELFLGALFVAIPGAFIVIEIATKDTTIRANLAALIMGGTMMAVIGSLIGRAPWRALADLSWNEPVLRGMICAIFIFGALAIYAKPKKIT